MQSLKKRVSAYFSKPEPTSPTDATIPPVPQRPTKCILLGLKQSVIDNTIAELRPDFSPAEFDFIPALGIEAMKDILQKQEIDHVFIGAGLPTDIRVEATKTVLETSLVTEVHLKNFSAGPQGYTPFIRMLCNGIKHEKSLLAKQAQMKQNGHA